MVQTNNSRNERRSELEAQIREKLQELAKAEQQNLPKPEIIAIYKQLKDLNYQCTLTRPYFKALV